MSTPPIHRREVLRALGLAAAALPLAGCGVTLPGVTLPYVGRIGGRRRAAPVPPATVPAVEPFPDPETAIEPLPRAPLAEVRAARPITLPPRLRRGGTIGLIAPAGVLRSVGQVDDAARDLQALGFRTKVGRHVLARFGFLAGTDAQRAEDVHRMFEDPDVDAIVCMRGGWGCARILPLLDYDLIRAHAKPLIGYSDVTALLLALYARAGLVSFHGPVGISTWSAATAGSFVRTLVDGVPLRIEGETRSGRIEGQTVTSGTAEGRLVGGNLSVVAALAGTGYLPDFDGHVAFFEEVGEESYRLDRLLTQLEQAGVLRAPAAVVFGQCSDCSDGGSAWSAERVLRDHLASYGCPAWMGAPVGHVSPVATLPIGLPVRTDADAGVLEALGPAVV